MRGKDMRILTADQRMQRIGIKGCLFGPAKIGKTYQLHYLDPETTLFVDLEAGGLSVQNWQGNSIEVKEWKMARDLACFLSGPNPAYRDDECYGLAHYRACCDEFGDPAQMDKYKTVFIDSITVSGRLCLQWCKGQPEAYSEKTGKADNRGKYGLHGQELVRWLTQLQYIPNKNLWLVGILEEKIDDFGRTIHAPQIDGQKAGLELPGIVDEVVSYVALPDEEGNMHRTFVCQNPNPWKLPAGDRSGKLNVTEEPNLQKLMNKINGGK
jgi:hypothetical protein